MKLPRTISRPRGLVPGPEHAPAAPSPKMDAADLQRAPSLPRRSPEKQEKNVNGFRRLLHHRPVSGVVGISDVIPVAGCLAATAMMTFTVAFTVHRVTVTTHSALAPA